MAADTRQTEEDTGLNDLSREELISKVRQLETHVQQLKNIIAKGNSDGSRGKTRKQRPFDFTKYNTRHVALKIAYLGWDYQGFAAQEDTDKTIEAAIFEALLKTRLIESRETSCYHRCGRTDKGVSAFSQVISLDLKTNLLEGRGVKIREGGSAHERPGDTTTEIRYVHILNKVLPPEIRVLAWCPVDPEFSARFSCLKRTYKYFFPRGNLDLKAITKAAERLVGEHDYRNLCKMDVGNGVVNFIRKIFSMDVKILDSEQSGYQMCELTIVGQAFLWHQIRCIVSVLFLIGQGKEKPEVIDYLLDVQSHPRKPQYGMASEVPLVLFECEYEDVDWIIEADWHVELVRHVQELWTQYSVKVTMLRVLLNQLETCMVRPDATVSQEPCPWREGFPAVLNQSESLIPGNKPRVYKPLLERECCESLEDRIEHFAKRRKVTGKKDTSKIDTPAKDDR